MQPNIINYMLHIFFKNITLTSSLTTEEITSRLRKITNTGSNETKYKSRFEGAIHKMGFLIYPTFNYQSMYRFRPEIIGTLTEHDNTTIELIFRLSKAVKFLLLTGFILNTLIMIYLIVEPSKNSFMFSWKIFALLIPLMLCLFLADFNVKVGRSERLLRHRFRAIG